MNVASWPDCRLSLRERTSFRGAKGDETRTRLRGLMLFIGLGLSGMCTARAATAADDDIQPATDRPQPKSPAESAACVQLPPGFRLVLVAAEPLVREPTAMAFDERGRLFVCEIHGYNLDGYLDIV